MNEYITCTYVFREVGTNDDWCVGQSKFDSIESYAQWLTCSVNMFGPGFEIVQTVIPIGFSADS